jgi:hypothetical protein
MVIWFEINGTFMGGEIKLNPTERRIIHGRVIGNSDIRRLEIIRDNKILSRIPTREMDVIFDYKDEKCIDQPSIYYVRAIQSDGNKVWSSPIWVDINDK